MFIGGRCTGACGGAGVVRLLRGVRAGNRGTRAGKRPVGDGQRGLAESRQPPGSGRGPKGPADSCREIGRQCDA